MTGTKAGSREADTKKILLGKGWLFHLGDCPDAWKKDYAPEGWQEVTLPHDWSVSLPFPGNIPAEPAMRRAASAGTAALSVCLKVSEEEESS